MPRGISNKVSKKQNTGKKRGRPPLSEAEKLARKKARAAANVAPRASQAVKAVVASNTSKGATEQMLTLSMQMFELLNKFSALEHAIGSELARKNEEYSRLINDFEVVRLQVQTLKEKENYITSPVTSNGRYTEPPTVALDESFTDEHDSSVQEDDTLL